MVYVCVYVSMVITYSKSMDQPVVVVVVDSHIQHIVLATEGTTVTQHFITVQFGTLSPKIMYNNYSLLLFWCPYMVINVSVQCNGGLLPDIILLTLCDSIGEPF